MKQTIANSIGLSWATRKAKEYSRAGLYEFLEAQLESLPAGSKVLDVGAGGPINAIIDQSKLDVLRIDVNESLGPDIVMDVTDMSALDDNTFDGVFLMEVLEHVPEPKLALEEIRRVLKPGGVLIMSVPFTFGIHDAPHDYYRFTKYGLEYLLKAYSDTDVKERTGYFHPMGVLPLRLLSSDGIGDKLIGLSLFFIVMGFTPLGWVLTRLTKSSNATTGYLVTATK